MIHLVILTKLSNSEILKLMDNTSSPLQTPSVDQQTLQTPPPLPNKKLPLVPLIGILIVSLTILGIIYTYFTNLQPPQNLFTNPTPTISYQPSPTPSNPTANWKTYANSKLDFEFKYPPSYKIIEESENKVLIATDQLGSDGFWVSNDRDSSFVNLNALKTCKAVYEAIRQNPSMPRPSCLEEGGKFGQKEDIADVRLGLAAAKEFYLTLTGQGNTVRVIQTINSPLLQVYIFFPNATSAKTIDQILSTFKFSDTNTVITSQAPNQIPTVSVRSTTAIISTKNTSPDGLYIVTEKLAGDYNTITIRDGMGLYVYVDDLVAKNYTEIGMGKKFGCQCAVAFRGWVNDTQFIIKIVNSLDEEYEYTVDAPSGKVIESSLKRIK